MSRLLLSGYHSCRAGSSIPVNSILSPKHLSTTCGLFQEKKDGFLAKTFGPESSIAQPSFKNRWAMFVPAFATHICLGAPYGWSAISANLSKEFGFVVSSSGDWALDLCTYPMSIMIAAGGLSAALFGKWTMKVGTRRSMVTGGALFGTAFGITALGVSMHSLPLLYAGNREYNTFLKKGNILHIF